MLPINSSFHEQVNQSSYILKSSFSENIKENISNNLFSQISFKTPIKEAINIPGNNYFSPSQIDLKYFFGNSCSNGTLSINPINYSFNNDSTTPNKDKLFEEKENNCFLIKNSSKDLSFKVSPESMKENISNNLISYQEKYFFSSENQSKNKTNENFYHNSIISKKNLFSLFNKDKEENLFFNENDFIINDFEKFGNENNFSDKKIYKLYSLDSPKKDNNIFKKLFECSNSTIETALPSSNNKRKRFRKNNKQLFLLKKFYSEHKNWSKAQIKEISAQVGIKENKVYKWLWDQKNKESKFAKFIVNKKYGKIDE